MVERETVTTATIKKWRAVVRLENPDEEVKEDEGDAAADTIETKPEDIDSDFKNRPELGGFTDGGFNAVMCDGAVRFIADSIDLNVLKILLQKDDGTAVPNF